MVIVVVVIVVVVVLVVAAARSADEEQTRGQPMVALWISGSAAGSRWGCRIGLSADAMMCRGPAAARTGRVRGSQRRNRRYAPPASSRARSEAQARI